MLSMLKELGNMLKKLGKAWNGVSLVMQILTGLVLAVILAFVSPKAAMSVEVLGELFVGALKAVAPVLVFLLVVSALAKKYEHGHSPLAAILLLYLAGTFLSALIAVLASSLVPISFVLPVQPDAQAGAPSNVYEVLHSLLLRVVDNPVNALATANYPALLCWGVMIGIGFRAAAPASQKIMHDLAEVITLIVQWIIRLAPYGIFGLVASTLVKQGMGLFSDYVVLLEILLLCMAFTAFIINPLLVYLKLRVNPYPLVFQCLKESGIPAFFTRSSAANIPVNLALCRKLNLREQTYAVSIPLGATINMSGAAITISVLTLVAVHSLNIPVDFPTALLLCFLASLGACGASGVASGSLLLIPMAASLFNIDHDVAMRVVAIAYPISVLQDSAETALNSSTDVVFTAAVDLAEQRKELLTTSQEG